MVSTVTVAGAMRTSMGSVNHWLAKVRMAGGRVAENSSVCRRRGTFLDPPQIVDKAHVEHPIGLVEDQHLDVRQVHVALLHQVQQAPGVAINTSTPWFKARTWGDWPTPP